MAPSRTDAPRRRFPAEWEAHEAVWIAWPHEESDFPGKLNTIDWVYAEIVRNLSRGERVEILCHSESIRSRAEACLTRSSFSTANVRFHLLANDRSWLRDSAPTGVLLPDGSMQWIAWQFTAWAKYENFNLDAAVPAFVAHVSAHEKIDALRPDTQTALVLEGGAIESDGAGSLLVTEECLLSNVQQRNPGLTREGYEQAFASYLGISNTIWLDAGCVGDDTHGHIDDIARFAPGNRILLAVEEDPTDENFAITERNLNTLLKSTNAAGVPFEVIPLPFPAARYCDGERLPASYANFYIANHCVLVPTFNDPRDVQALNLIAAAFPDREVVGIYCGDLILGLGTLHCLSQQQPLGA